MADTLFAHLALTFGKHPENLATEALGHVLRHSVAARAALHDLLLKFGVDVPSELSWVTQVGGKDDARPDLVGLSGDGEQPVVVEAKFWAGLTEHQPVTYLGRRGLRALVFVAPAARAVHLWDELRRRCAGNVPLDEVAAPLPGTRLADIAGKRLAFISWRTLVAAMMAAAEASEDRRAAADLGQLQGLCDRMDSEAFLPVTSEELTTHVYRRVVEFGALVDDVVAQLVERGAATTKGVRVSKGNGWYGRYLWLRGVGVLALCDVRKWNKYAATPLWLSVYGANWHQSAPQAAREALAKFEAATPQRMFIATDGFPTVPLFVPAGLDRDGVLSAVVEQAVEVGDLVAPLGVSGAAVEPPLGENDPGA